MKYVLFALAVVFAASGCSKYEVYERNLQYMTMETFEAERSIAIKELEQAQSELAEAQASGDKARIAKATEKYKLAWEKAKSVNAEERRRNRPY